MDTNLLLTDEEYQQHFFQKDFPTPYIYKLQSDGQLLVYFGVRHSRNPDDEQWNKLKSCWADFLQHSNSRRIILLEGDGPTDVKGDWADVIKKRGEVGALLILSHDSGSEIAHADPPINQEAQELAKKFEPDLVAYYIFARSAGAWLRGGTMGTFDEVLAKAASVTSRRIPGAPDSVPAYSAIHERVFNHPLDESQEEVIIRASAPVYHDSVVNDIARASSRFRNEHIVSEIELYWKDGYSIFLLFGSAHAVIQESALRDMVENKLSKKLN